MWVVKRVFEEDDEFHECHDEHETWTPTGVAIAATRVQDENEGSENERCHDEAYEETFASASVSMRARPAHRRPVTSADGNLMAEAQLMASRSPR